MTPNSSSKAAAELIFFDPYQRFVLSRPSQISRCDRAGWNTSLVAGLAGAGSDHSRLAVFGRSKAAPRLIELRNPSATPAWQHVLDAFSATRAGKHVTPRPEDVSRAPNVGPRSSKALTG